MGFFDALVNAVSDAANGIASAASVVGDAVEAVVDAVVDTAESVVNTVADVVQDAASDVIEAVCDSIGGSVFGDAVCGVVTFVVGIVDGAVEAIRDLAHDVADICRDGGGFIASVLRLDLPGALQHLGSWVIDVVDLFVDLGRVVTQGYFVGGIVHQFERNSLRAFVEELLRTTFERDDAALATARTSVGLGTSARFGFPLRAEHRVFTLDSANTDLADLHKRGVIDLFTLAGLLSFSSFQMARPRTVVRRVDFDGSDMIWPVTRVDIVRFLDSNGQSSRLRVYAMSRPAIAESVRTASEKCEQLGVRLLWNDGEEFAWFRSYSTHGIGTETEYRFPLANDFLDRYLVQRGLRGGTPEEDCVLVALGAFRYASSDRGNFGWTAGRRIKEGAEAESCATPGRTDGCCSTVNTSPAARGAAGRGSGVIHRDVWPDYFFRYVLAHEIGHYLGLCHFGHNGFQNIMWKPGPIDGEGNRLGLLSWGTFRYYLDSEPHFTLDDAKNAWRFIANQMQRCLVPPNLD